MVQFVKSCKYITTNGKLDGLLVGISLALYYVTVQGSSVGDPVVFSKVSKYGNLDGALIGKSLGHEVVMYHILGEGYFFIAI